MNLRKASCLALLMATANTVSAATENWYKVELLIFSRSGAESSEQWEPLPELAYPPEEQARFLIDPEASDKLAAELDAFSHIDERGIQHLEVRDPGPGAMATDQDFLRPISTAHLKTLPLAENFEQLRSFGWPRPFTQLQREQMEFASQARRLAAGGEVLFHQAWLQPMASEEEALPIVLDRSGDEQSYPRLQGSITLHLSRYLHLRTQLWLNTHGEYLDGTWEMPAPPLAPLSRTVSRPWYTPPVLPEEELLGAATPINTDPSVFGAPAQHTADSFGDAGLEATVPGSGFPDSDEIEPAPYEEETGPQWPWRHAVPMVQARRMRGEQIHYLDHPMMGLVIKLTPIKAEALDAWLAEEEAAAASAVPEETTGSTTGAAAGA